uniref:Uncharacterized protein n=1 Tax=Oryza glumipatula TaxID=40148 RepID=A0A0E0BPK3_9ORYZ
MFLSGGQSEVEATRKPQRHEPGGSVGQPVAVARLLLLRQGAAEHVPQDVGRPAGERRGGAGRAAAARQGELAGAARQVHQRRRGRRGQRGHVRQELHLLKIIFD